MKRNEIYLGDCLELMPRHIEDKSVDMILCDLPYGTVKGAKLDGWNGTKTDWDEVIDTNEVYKVANRILRKNGKMVLFCQEPFTTELITKAIPNIPHSYNMIWEKDHYANALIAKKAPVNYYEDVLVFSKMHQKHDFEGKHPLRDYFKIIMDFVGGTKKHIIDVVGQRADHVFRVNSTQFSLCTEQTYKDLVRYFKIDKVNEFKEFAELKQIDVEYRTDLLKQMNEQYPSIFNLWEGNKYKSNILKYKKDYDGHHPTQKPVLLLEDLIKTFSNENDLVVDLTMGSGSTGVAARNTNRNFIGIEKDENYFNIAVIRIKGTEPNPNSFEKTKERGLFSFTDEPDKLD